MKLHESKAYKKFDEYPASLEFFIAAYSFNIGSMGELLRTIQYIAALTPTLPVGFVTRMMKQTPWLPLIQLLPHVMGATELNGKHLTIAAEHWPPYFTISVDQGNPVFSGVMSLVLEYLQTTLNFTSTIVRPPDGTWGATDATGQWGGMVGMVNRNEVDFALGEPTI